MGVLEVEFADVRISDVLVKQDGKLATVVEHEARALLAHHITRGIGCSSHTIPARSILFVHG